MSVRERKWVTKRGVHSAFVADYVDAYGVRRMETFPDAEAAARFEEEHRYKTFERGSAFKCPHCQTRFKIVEL